MSNKKRNFLCIIGIALISLIMYVGKNIYDSNNSKNIYLSQFQKQYKDYEIMNYDSGDKGDMVKFALSYKEKDIDVGCKIAIFTDLGIGFLDIAVGDSNYEFYDNGKLKIESENIVNTVLVNTQSKEVIDYSIKSEISNNDITFSVSGTKRE